MTISWLSNDFDYNTIILAGDIGGTNTNLALVGADKETYTLIAKMQWPSVKVKNILEPVFHILHSTAERHPRLKPSVCCISAAGPVRGNRCSMTNCAWDVDGDLVKSETGIDTVVINDFVAISHAVPLLDVNDPGKIVKVPHVDGSLPNEREGVKLIIGPGTGLGIGFLVPVDGEYIPFPSEGGHSDFAPHSAETRELCEFLSEKTRMKPGVEPFVSGQGIANIYDFLRCKKPDVLDEKLPEVDAASDSDKPALIERYSGTSRICRETMILFVSMLGSFTGSMSTVFLPSGGVYIAGGMVARNENIILSDDVFMKHFEMNYRVPIAQLLKQVPVYLIRDYSISLYGAANAAIRHLRKKEQ